MNTKPRFNIYKPLKKADAGSAFQFTYSDYKQAIFLEAASQKGERLETGSKNQFSWDNKITFKIGVTDIGKLLLVFTGHESSTKCIHASQNVDYTSVLELTKGEYQGKPNFSMKLSKTADKATQRIQIFLSQEEVLILAHFMREALTRMMGFNNVEEA